DEVGAVEACERCSLQLEAAAGIERELAVQAAGDLHTEGFAVAERAIHYAVRAPTDLTLQLYARDLGLPAGLSHGDSRTTGWRESLVSWLRTRRGAELNAGHSCWRR